MQIASRRRRAVTEHLALQACSALTSPVAPSKDPCAVQAPTAQCDDEVIRGIDLLKAMQLPMVRAKP